MSILGTGLQSTSNASSFMGLCAPIHLPSLVSKSGEDSIRLPRGHQTLSIEVQGTTDIAPERQGVDFGQVDYFKYINNDNEVLKSCTLAVRLDALAVGAGGAPGDRPRYVDDILCAAVERIEMQFGGNVLQTIYGDELHFRNQQECLEEELMRKNRLQAAGLSDAERATLATNQQWVYLEIPFWWTRSPSANWHQYAFQRLTRFVIYFRNSRFLLQQDNVADIVPVPAGGAGYIVDHFLRFSICSVSEATKQTYMSMIQAEGDRGFLYLIQDWQRLTDQVLPAGSTTDTVLLNTFTKFGYNMRFWLRPAANLLADTRNNNRWATVDIISMHMDISGKRFLPELDRTWLKDMVNGKYFAGNSQLAIYNVLFTEFPDLHHQGMGGMEFSNTTNPTLVLTTAALPANVNMDIYLYCHNYVRLVLKGVQSAAETVQPL